VDVRSVAHRGDNLESMAYDKTQVETRQRVFTLLARRGERPAAVLLFGGGNDIAGPELVMALEHVKSELSLVNEEVLKQLLLRLRKALVSLVSAIEVQSTALFGSPLPVVMHGYGFPVPDDEGRTVHGCVVPASSSTPLTAASPELWRTPHRGHLWTARRRLVVECVPDVNALLRLTAPTLAATPAERRIEARLTVSPTAG
jgi:hypothetical protein